MPFPMQPINAEIQFNTFAKGCFSHKTLMKTKNVNEQITETAVKINSSSDAVKNQGGRNV